MQQPARALPQALTCGWAPPIAAPLTPDRSQARWRSGGDDPPAERGQGLRHRQADQALNQVRSSLVTAAMALRERLSGLSRNELITICASFRPGELVGPLAAAKRAMRSLAQRIQALEAEPASKFMQQPGITG
jgi:hypothetical protein